MEAVDAMHAQTLDKDTIDRPQIDSWRRTPSREQIRYATDLCRSELPYAERVATIASFPSLDGAAISELIDTLAAVRQRRMARLRRSSRRRRC
jgi:hypothetical protein